MDLKLKIFNALCSTEIFIINDIKADSEDFGEQGDDDEENAEDAEDYACGNMVFKRKPSTTEVLERYKITETEYQEIANKLEEGLSFGSCGWCI